MKDNIRQIPWSKPYLTQSERDALLNAFDSGWISSGKYVEEFETKLNKIFQSPHGLCTSSGTSALNLCLQVLSLNTDDEVIVPGYCFAAAVNAVIRCGAKPVFADVDLHKWSLTAETIERCISPRTKAVIVVHNYGGICDMDAVADLCRRKNIVLIEDAAEAVFSRFNSRYAGTFGDMAAFSFQAAKTITTGEGGYVAVKNKEHYDKMRLLRSHGMSETQKYFHTCIGDNFRMTDLQAAIGVAQLENSTSIITQKKKIYRQYQELLQKWEGVKLQSFDILCDPVVWTTAVLLDRRSFSQGRGWLMHQLLQKGIETRPGFSSFREMGFYRAPFLNNTENISVSILCLPSFCGLAEDDISYICETLKQTAGVAV